MHSVADIVAGLVTTPFILVLLLPLGDYSTSLDWILMIFLLIS